MTLDARSKDVKVDGEQILLSKLLDDESVQRMYGVHVEWLDGCSFANGQWYSSTEYQLACLHPKVLQNNWIVGVHEKESDKDDPTGF